MFQQDGSAKASGMALNIHEALLHYAEEGNLLVSSQPAKIIRYLQLHFDSRAFGKTCGIVADGVCQSCFVEHGRVQNVRERADFPDRAVRQGFTLRHRLPELAVRSWNRGEQAS